MFMQNHALHPIRHYNATENATIATIDATFAYTMRFSADDIALFGEISVYIYNKVYPQRLRNLIGVTMPALIPPVTPCHTY
jgi:hypothetical protein